MNQIEGEDTGSFKSGHIITQTELSQVRKDIQEMITPSWLTSVPTNLGSTAHGKLKADQWQVLGTTYLPISLIQLWGKEDASTPTDLQRRKMLLMTVDLLSAVVIASSRKTSETNTHHYTHLMQKYLVGVQDIFSTYKFCPNHHMAMHLQQFFIDFGPAHSIWTFPFEHLIGILQRTPHNGKIGKL
ncbi:hypothetical protein BJ165DRAFT_1350659 [Panaeolus papilionaceus]|nr:hypothetical protein BJ165DRAFT_1350659 [Panaeolus papilionaceus]